MKVWDESSCSLRHAVVPAIHPSKLKDLDSIPTVLEVYSKVYTTMQMLGSSSFVLKKNLENPSQQPSPMDPSLKFPYFTCVTDARSLCIYHATKLVLVIHELYFIVRFVNLFLCDQICPDRRVLLLAISCYIWALIMVIGIYFLCHLKRVEIYEFFNKLNRLDHIVFGKDVNGRREFIGRHERVYNRVKYYIPLMILTSMAMIGMNHANHPHFYAHLTSLVFTTEETFFTNWKTTFVARCFNWCLEALTKESSKLILKTDVKVKVRLVEDTVGKFEHIRGLMNEYNGIFKGLFLFFKGILILQITIMAYIPVKRLYVVPFSSIMIFFALTLHYVAQIVMVLCEAGRVFHASRMFQDNWMRNLQKSGLCVTDTGLNLKMLLETCTPFGFDCGGCYVVDTRTVLTFFSIITSYLIVLLQLQI
ncbi:unnamed protein product [Orchesella dallaii]|uniref:Gustatory receptor n=1 Tax=Orchesella dallaii TaxID=48710 RepID=A0ABP1PPJ8_9HEXA